MASLNELINLSQYKSGDMGRANLPTIRRDTPQEQQRKSLVLQSLASELAIRQQQEAIAKRQRELWDSVGLAKDSNKTTAGIAENVVDNEEAGGRDIIPVGSSKKPDADSGYEAAISRRGDMYLRPKAEAKPYDRVKVIDRAKKIVEAEMLEEGIDRTATGFANAFNVRLKKSIPQAEIDLYGEATTEAPEAPAKAPEYNTITHNDMIQGALDEPKRFITSLGGAKDFYFGAKDKPVKTSTIKEGQTAVNPKTGQRIIYKGGSWHKAQ